MVKSEGKTKVKAMAKVEARAAAKRGADQSYGQKPKVAKQATIDNKRSALAVQVAKGGQLEAEKLAAEREQALLQRIVGALMADPRKLEPAWTMIEGDFLLASAEDPAPSLWRVHSPG